MPGGAFTAMEMYYVLAQNPPSTRRVLCERVAAVGYGFWLYRYDPSLGRYVDVGYARDLGQVKLEIASQHGVWFHELFLIKGFEKTANLFVLRGYPRVIYLMPQEDFCVRTADTIFSAEIDGGEMRVEEWIGGEKPKSVKEALEALSNYAQRANTWVVFKHGAGRAEARLAIP
jgi:hypothetical protein